MSDKRINTADRTRSAKWRAGTRRNKKIKNVKTFRSDVKDVSDH